MSDEFDLRLKTQLQALADAVPMVAERGPATGPAAHDRVATERLRTRSALPIGSLAAVVVIAIVGLAIVPRMGLGGSSASPTPDAGHFTPTAAVPGSVVLSPRVVASFGSDELTAAVLGPDGAAYVLDATTKTVYRVDLRSGTKLPVLVAGQASPMGTGGVGTPRLLTTGGSDVLILDASNALWRWHPAEGDTAGRGVLAWVNIPDSVNWGTGARAMGTFVVNAALNQYDLYVVLPSQRQIYKYAPAADGSGYPAAGRVRYLGVDEDVSAIDDIYVDGKVYLVGSGGVTQYLLGQVVSGWTLAKPAAPPSTAPTYARLTADDPAQDRGNLYAHLRSNRAVFAFAKKDGSYVAQYSVSSDTAWLSALTGMFVVPGSGTAKGTLYWVESGYLVGAALDGSGAPMPSASVAPIPSASAVAAPSVSMPSSARSANAGPTYLTYTVQAGDSMQSIARKFGVTLQALIDANPQLQDPNHLEVGWLLNIPQPVSPSRS